MPILETKFNKNKSVLALGAESAGNFSVFWKGKIYFSEDFGDLLQDTNFNKYKHELNEFLQKNKIKPEIVLTDLHPLYRTTIWGRKLATKFKAKHIQVQHHEAHIFSAVGDKALQTTNYKLPTTLYGIAMDGTGYGTDGKIWGGEIFRLQTTNHKLQTNKIGHLENQILIGGDLAVQEPARMLISILNKFLQKAEVYKYTKKYYPKNKFEVLYQQLQQNFNCSETSSTGRILDAVSILLGFCSNKRNYKHEPIDLLEKNSGKPYILKPVIVFDKKEKQYILQTTPLFEYLIKNLNKDKKRLAATAQLYIAQGLFKIIKRHHGDIKCPPLAASLGHLMSNQDIFIAGGIAKNKIISSYLDSRGTYIHPVKFAKGDVKLFNRENKTTPRGDAGLSFGQIIYYLLTNPRDQFPSRHFDEF